MPRKSAAALSVVPKPLERRVAEPPVYLSEDEAEIWRDVVSSMPADWFDAAVAPMISAYCGHAVKARELQVECNQDVDPEEIGLRDKLLSMREREVRAMTSLATRLRISPSSRWSEQKAHTAHEKAQRQEYKPWDPQSVK